LIFLDYFKFTLPLRSPVEPAIVTIKKAIYQGTFKIKFLPKIILDYERIVEGYSNQQKLELNLRELKMQLEEEKAENASLRKQLGAPLPSSFSFIPAEVVAVTRFMEIDIGSASGVKIGLSVVDGDTLIGRISQVTSNRSQVQLLSDSEIRVPAITNRGSRGQVSGQLGEFLLFSDVLQKDPLFLEDILVTTGEGGFPKDLLIGAIARITSDDVAVYKKAQVEPFIDPHMLRKIYIIEES